MPPAFLDYALAGKLCAIALGQAKYSLLLAESGGIIDDLVVYRAARSEFLVVANAGNREAVVAALTERAAGFDVRVEDQSDDIALIAVQGPNARAILEATTAITELGTPLADLKYYWSSDGYFEGVPLLHRAHRLHRRGRLRALHPHAMPQPGSGTRSPQAGADHGLVPAGLASRDTLRLEAGMPLYGHELGLDTFPVQAGLGRVVALAKEGDFVGRAAVEAGPAADARVLVGLDRRGPARRPRRLRGLRLARDRRRPGRRDHERRAVARRSATRSRWPTSTPTDPRSAPRSSSTSAAPASRHPSSRSPSTSARSNRQAP